MNIKFIKNPVLQKRLVWAIIIVGVLSFAKDFIIKKTIESAATNIIGAKVSIQSFSFSLFLQRVKMKNLTISNPPGFSTEPLITLPEVLVKVDPLKILSKKMRFPLIIINLREMVLVKNEEGKLNIDALKIVEDAKKKDKEPAPEVNFSIDRFLLNVGRVVYKDYSKSKGKGPIIQVFEVGIKNKVIENIDSPTKLIGSVIFEALKPTALRQAGMLAATTLMGVGFLPAAAFGVIVAKDNASAEVKHSFNRAFDASLTLAKTIGEIKRFDKKTGQIFAKIYGCDVTVKIEKSGLLSSNVKIQARKFLLAKPQIAAGILYQLLEQLK